MAEREGFEPSVRLPAHVISNHAPSATRSPLRCRFALKNPRPFQHINFTWGDRSVQAFCKALTTIFKILFCTFTCYTVRGFVCFRQNVFPQIFNRNYEFTKFCVGFTKFCFEFTKHYVELTELCIVFTKLCIKITKSNVFMMCMVLII